MLPTRTHFRAQVTQITSEGMEKIFHANGNDKKAVVAIVMSDKIDFKTKAIKKDNEGHYITIRGSIQKEDIPLINIYATQYRST